MKHEAIKFTHAVKLNHCPACLGRNVGPYLTGSDYHYGIAGVFSTDRCSDCETVFINPMPDSTDLSALYPDDYYSYREPQPEPLSRKLVRKVLRYPRVYTVPHFSRPGTMVDVGCGAGHYLLEMRRRGWTVYGAELSKGAAAAGRKAGLDIRGGELTEAGFADKMFDFVRSNHAFEHIPNPDTILPEMHRILKDDGKMFIGIPNYDGTWAKMFKQYWWNFGLPVHTFNYSIKGVTTLLERNGFNVDKIVYNSDYTGLIGSLQIKRNSLQGIHESGGSLMRNLLIRMPAHYLSKVMDIFKKGDCIEIIASKKLA